MNKLLIVVIIFIISVVFVPSKQEGFTSYFRQTVRPHMRAFRSAQETFSYRVNTTVTDFGRRLGLF